MKTPYDPTPEQRAAMDRAKNGASLNRAWHGTDKRKDLHRDRIVPVHARPVRK
jgi:hypothetical protein